MRTPFVLTNQDWFRDIRILETYWYAVYLGSKPITKTKKTKNTILKTQETR